jgi:hypothetical protein
LLTTSNLNLLLDMRGENKMIRLHPETGAEIANLINTIDASEIMLRKSGTDLIEQMYWMSKKFKAIISLTENYGIPHSNYNLAVKNMKLDMYANATLSGEAE